MSELDSLLEFTRLMSGLSSTERFINKPNTEVRENLAEHSSQLAFTAWYLIEKNQLKLNKEKVLQYALIHDIVEVNTGDFPTHLPDFDRSIKEQKEKESLEKLKKDYPDAPALWDAYSAYEKHEDEESKFVYALDKLLPELNIYLDSCKAWVVRDPKDNTWNFDTQLSKMQVAPFVAQLWQELRGRIKEEHPDLTA